MSESRGFTYTKEFDEKYCYNGKDLGAVCKEGRTTFKVWSPNAEQVELYLYRDQTSDAYRKEYLRPTEKGVWQMEFSENLHGTYYDYLIVNNGRPVRTADPYAVACGCNGIRSMVVDLKLTDPEGFEKDKVPAPETEQIIYELHIKDFSHDPNSGVPAEYRGKYKAFTVPGKKGEYPAGVEYLKSLGVTHVHLLPFYDYGFTDEAGDDNQFNWGYDPVNYNVPEGTYATDVNDGTVRIRECKEMIQSLHENGLRVVMDVVYNHTYEADSWLERTVPGYYYRHMEDGKLSDGSACGNDVAAGRAMVDNYIADSVMYWAKEYHIDGFRFDLMGLLTVELMNRIRRELDAEFGEGKILLYGEPWKAAESPMESGTNPALKSNIHMLDAGVALFSDDTRDVIKGSVFFEEDPGFVNGASGLENKVLGAVTGWKEGSWGFDPKCCGQIINYVSAHDNFTLWDKLVLSMHGPKALNGKAGIPDYTKKYEDVLAANKLAAFMYFTCQGHVFMQAGEEFGRTKFGDENSYRSDPKINMLDWKRTEEYTELVDYYRGLIRLRKKMTGLTDKSSEAHQHISDKKVLGEKLVSFQVENPGAETERLFVVYNASDKDCTVTLPDGEWLVLADAKETDCCKPVKGSDKTVRVEACSGMLLGRKAE